MLSLSSADLTIGLRPDELQRLADLKILPQLQHLFQSSTDFGDLLARKLSRLFTLWSPDVAAKPCLQFGRIRFESLLNCLVEETDENLRRRELVLVVPQHLFRTLRRPRHAPPAQVRKASKDSSVRNTSPETLMNAQTTFDCEMGEIMGNGRHVPHALYVIPYTIGAGNHRFVSAFVEAGKLQ